MRYTIDDGLDDGRLLPPKRLDFELDGQRIFIVQAADDIEGWIEAPLISIHDGNPHFENDDYTIVRKYGKVRIIEEDPLYSRMDEEYLQSRNNIPPWTTAAQSGNYLFATDRKSSSGSTVS